VFTYDNNVKVEIGTRLKKGNNCYYGLGKILSAKAVSKNLKMQIYMTLIRPNTDRRLGLSGKQNKWGWRFSKGKFWEGFLDHARIIEPENGWNDITKNSRTFFNALAPYITKEISVRRMRWAGHAWWKQGSITRSVIENNPAGKWFLGRPRLRWEVCVIKDVRRIEDSLQWREEAEDRNRWRSIYLEGWS